jgi:DNA-binding LacI/PurR family transcriptional regulator
MADISNPFYPAVLEIFLKKLQAAGQRAMLLLATRDQQVDDLLPQLLEYQIDGLVITSATLSSEMAERCAEWGVPVVLFNRSVPNTHSSSVCCDNQGAARKVAELFLQRGFTSIAYMAGAENTSTNSEREQGFFLRLAEEGITPVKVVGDFTHDGGYQAALELAKNGQYPQAVFCANDIMAMGAMEAIRYQLHLSIPDDVSIVGFDDIANSSWPAYNLTTIRPPVERMVQRAIDNLLDNQEREKPVQVAEVVSAELVIRGSTA